MIAMPIYGSMTDVKYHNKPYFPLVESPGVIYIQKVQESGNAAKAVMEAVLQGWPVLVLTLIMAALSGIVMWALVSFTYVRLCSLCLIARKPTFKSTVFFVDSHTLRLRYTIFNFFVGFVLEP